MAAESPTFNWPKVFQQLNQRGYAIDPHTILPETDPNRISNAVKVIPFIESALPEVVEMILTAKKYSFQEYLGYAVVWGLRALSQGNYGIGALYVFNYEGEEWLIAGRNGLVTDCDTSKHAEMDAIDAIESIARGEDTYKDRIVLRRKARDNENRKMLMTSLDPCPMCHVRILNHNIDLVGVGNEDKMSGSMVRENAEMMPPIWKIIRGIQGTIVTLANDDPEDYSYVNPKYLPIVKQMFDLNREKIDQNLKEGSLTDITSFTTIAHGLSRLCPQEAVFDPGIKAILN